MVLISVKRLGRRVVSRQSSVVSPQPSRGGSSVFIAVLLLAVTIAACGDDTTDPRPQVVVTTTILGDLVTAIAGDDAAVTVLVPRGADPHDFSPSAQQMTRIGEADLVILNGLGLEEGLEEAIAVTADPGAVVLAIAEMVDPMPFAEGADPGDLDPHVWLDPVRMATAAELVGAALEQLDPDDGYDARTAQYVAELEGANDAVEALLAGIPAERRLLVTNHESMDYFAARYGFRIVGVVIPGGSTLAEPSSAELAALVETIRREGVTAIFAETTHPIDLAAAIAAEAERDVVVVELFTESLGETGSAAGTLPGMLVENARRIAAALGG